MSEEYKIEFSIKAKEDIEELKTLTYLPQKFAIIDDETIRDLKIRKLNIKNHIAFYRINEDRKVVNIERVLYGGSDWINKL